MQASESANEQFIHTFIHSFGSESRDNRTEKNSFLIELNLGDLKMMKIFPRNLNEIEQPYG